MTKPKIKPVLAWCMLNHNGDIRPGWLANDMATVMGWGTTWNRECIRVEIRPAPKRRKPTKRGRK